MEPISGPMFFRNQPIRWIDIPNNRLGKEEYLTDRLNIEAVDFVTKQRHKPFFLLLSHYAPHTILNGRPDLVEKYRVKHPPGTSTRNRCYLCEDAGLKPLGMPITIGLAITIPIWQRCLNPSIMGLAC